MNSVCRQMRADASVCIFFAAKYSPFFIADFLLHVKMMIKIIFFVMPIIGKEERKNDEQYRKSIGL